jgi:hypothetical protein
MNLFKTHQASPFNSNFNATGGRAALDFEQKLNSATQPMNDKFNSEDLKAMLVAQES